MEIPEVDVHAPLKIEQDDSLEQVRDSDLDKKNKILFTLGIIIGLVILSLIILIGNYYFQSNKQEKLLEKKSNEITSVIKNKDKSLNKDDFVFEVLNGSGKTGEAKRVAEIIESLGFKVAKTGNADETESTELFLDKKLINQSKILIKVLENNIKITTVSGDFKTDTTASARIIIGIE